jgi:hypothetical protein
MVLARTGSWKHLKTFNVAHVMRFDEFLLKFEPWLDRESGYSPQLPLTKNLNAILLELGKGPTEL